MRSLNGYSNRVSYHFDQIVNLCTARTVEECYESSDCGPVYIKDENGKRNLRGQKNRITTIGREELKLFARIMDDSDDWNSARLMSIYAEDLIDTLKCFDIQDRKLVDLKDDISVSMLWDET